MINRRKLLSGAASAALAAGLSDAHSGFLRGAIGIPLQTTFSFTVGSTSTTSAGVFDVNGVLVRTLWSNVSYAAGTYTATWDGTLDGLTGIGSVAASGVYTIKVLSSQVAYTWQGVIGNTSASWTDATTNHSSDITFGMAITSSFIYYCVGYDETHTSFYKAAIGNPQAKTAILSTGTGIGTPNGANSTSVATDGTDVYWACSDAQAPNNTWIVGTKTSDDTQVPFSSGVSITPIGGPTYTNAIDQVNTANSQITGLAVQTGGLGYLCVARKNLGTIDVLNKTTGALLSSDIITTPTGLACDGANGLWVIQGTSVVQFTINSGGTLTATGLSITGLQEPLAVAVSPDGTTILVADGGTSQQIKAFSSTTAASTWTFGTAGGYATNGPAVSNSKFYFYNPPSLTFLGVDWSFLAYQPDGSFWVGDMGNYRAQYFTAGPSPTYSTTLMWLPAFYSCNVDPNNPTRVFGNALEFQIDYTKTLGPANGSWTLVNNWLPNIIANTPPYYDKYYLLANVATLSNGRTYAQLHNTSNNQLQTVELVAGSGLRFTGFLTTNILYTMLSNGDLGLITFPLVVNNPIVFSKQALTGFDGSGNPQYGALTTVATSPAVVANGPAWYESAGTFATPWRVTTSGIIPVLDGKIPRNSTTDAASHAGWHLGGLNVSTGVWQWQNSPTGPSNYFGNWITNGTFDIGNNVLSAGSRTNVLGNNVFYQYFGESWKNAETNEWSHFSDDGLMVGQFGTTTSGVEGQPSMAGNAFSNTVVLAPDGNTYAYHNDESYHGGVHRWLISNLSTIARQSISIMWYSWQYLATSDPTDLLAGLPYSASLVSGTPATWTFNPTTQILTSPSLHFWQLITNYLNYSPLQSPDLRISFSQSSTATPTPPYTAACALPTPSPSTTSWTLTTTISWTSPNADNGGTNDGLHFDVVDGANKIIARVDPIQVTLNSSYKLSVNGVTLFSFSGTTAAFQAIINTPTLLTISASGGNITFTWGVNGPTTVAPFDGTSVWNEPSSVLTTGFSMITAGYLPHSIDFQTMHFSHVP